MLIRHFVKEYILLPGLKWVIFDVIASPIVLLMKWKANRKGWVETSFRGDYSLPLPRCSLFVFAQENSVALFNHFFFYEAAIKRLWSFLSPSWGHSSISVSSFCERGWATWIGRPRRARTINLCNGTVLFYLLFSTFFLMHSLILHAFISPSLPTEQMFSPSRSQPSLSGLCFFLPPPLLSCSFLLSGYNNFRTQERAWLIRMCCFLSASPCLCHTAFHLLLWCL